MNIECEDFSGILYYLVLNSPNGNDLCVLKLDGHLYVMGSSKPYQTYTEISNMILDEYCTLDLFYIRDNLSLGWMIQNGINERLLKEIGDELQGYKREVL